MSAEDASWKIMSAEHHESEELVSRGCKLVEDTAGGDCARDRHFCSFKVMQPVTLFVPVTPLERKEG